MEEFNRKQNRLLIWTMVIAIAAIVLSTFCWGVDDESISSLGMVCFAVGCLTMLIGMLIHSVRGTRIYRVCKKAGVTGKTKDADIAIIKAKCNEMGVEEKDAIDFYEQSEFTATSIGFSPKRLALFILLAGILSIVVSCAINGGDSGGGGRVCPSCGRTVSRLYGGMCKTCHDNYEWGMSALGR